MLAAVQQTVSAVIPADVWLSMSTRAQRSPMMVHPLARDGGYELFLSQYANQVWAFTSLLEYKTHQDNATPRLLLTHYTDLLASKGAVLMAGELEKPLSLLDAQVLAHQIQIFYGGSPDDHRLARAFNHEPQAFDVQAVIARCEKLLKATAAMDKL